MVKLLSKFGISFLLLTILGFSSFQLQKKKRTQSKPSLSPPWSHLPKPLIKLMTLGHDRLYDDFIYLWLIQYLIPEEDTALEPFPILLRRTISALKQRPPIEPLYLLSCYVHAFRYKQPQTCQEILIIGMSAMPQSWKIPMTLGYLYAFNLEDKETGGHYYEVASQKKGAPKFLSSLANKLKSGAHIHSQDLQKSLNLIYGNAPEEQTEEVKEPNHEPK